MALYVLITTHTVAKDEKQHTQKKPNRDLLNSFNDEWYEELAKANIWTQRFEKCMDMMVKLGLEHEQWDEVPVKRVNPKIAQQREKMLILDEKRGDTHLASKLIQFIVDCLYKEQHHQTRICCVRLLNICSKSFEKQHFTNLNVLQSLFSSLIGKCMVDKRSNLHDLVVPTLMGLWIRVCFCIML